MAAKGINTLETVTIHQFWDNRNIPSTLTAWQQTWKDIGLSYKLWSYNDCEYLLSKYLPNSTFKYDIQKWDVLRLLICYEYGGIYADVDCEFAGNSDDLIFNSDTFISERVGSTTKLIHPYFFFAHKGSTFLRYVIKNISSLLDETYSTDRFLKEKGRIVKDSTGPCGMTRLYTTFSYKQSVCLIDKPAYLIHHNTKSWL